MGDYIRKLNHLTKGIIFDYLVYNFNEFVNMDIRAMVGRKNSAEGWKLIFMKIMLSNKTNAVIEAEHEKISNDIPKLDNETGKLISMCLPANNLISFIEQLDAGSIRMKDEQIDCGDNMCIQNIEFKKYDNHFTNDVDFTYWVGSVVHSTLTETISA